VDVAARRARARRAGALTEFTLQYGERGLQALGGREAASAMLAAEPDTTDSGSLLAALAGRLG
jgi:hypothetical protein